MFFAANSKRKAEILLPKLRLKFELVHCSIPQSDDALNNLINKILLEKSEDDYFLKRGLVPS
jgi:hypothetical protein